MTFIFCQHVKFSLCGGSKLQKVAFWAILETILSSVLLGIFVSFLGPPSRPALPTQSERAIRSRDTCVANQQHFYWHLAPFKTLMTSSWWRHRSKKSKIQSAPIELKIGTGMFSNTPDTMVMLILRENDVIKVLMTSSSKGSSLKKVKNSKCSNRFFFLISNLSETYYIPHIYSHWAWHLLTRHQLINMQKVRIY